MIFEFGDHCGVEESGLSRLAHTQKHAVFESSLRNQRYE